MHDLVSLAYVHLDNIHCPALINPLNDLFKKTIRIVSQDSHCRAEYL